MGLGLIDGTQSMDTFDAGLYGMDCAKGVMAGYIATAATSSVPVRATAYVSQGIGAQRSIVSTSALDTAAGNGARQVTISYLTTAFVLKQETVTLNGTTSVNTVNTDIAYLEAKQVTAVGSAKANAGTINILTGIGGAGTVWGSIAPGDNRTFWAHHYVPAGVTCYLLSIFGGSTVVAGAVAIVHGGFNAAAPSPILGVGGQYPHTGPGSVFVKSAVNAPIVGPDLIIVNVKPNAVTASVEFAQVEYAQR